MLKYSFLPPAASEKVGAVGTLHSNTQRVKFSQVPAAAMSHLQPQHLPHQLRAVETQEMRKEFLPWEMQGKRVQRWVEWAGGQGRSIHSGDRAASKALPQHCEAAGSKHHSLCSSRSPCTQPKPTAPREANPPSKGLQWHPPGCHSPTQPQSPRGFSHTCLAGEQCQGLSTPWREMALETP